MTRIRSPQRSDPAVEGVEVRGGLAGSKKVIYAS